MSEPYRSLSDDEIVARPLVTRRGVLRLAAGLGGGALAAILGGCAMGGRQDSDSGDPAASSGGADSDPSDGTGGGGGGWNETGGGGGSSTPSSDHKYGDTGDVTVSADFQDLDSDARDTSDHAHTSTADGGSNDYD